MGRFEDMGRKGGPARGGLARVNYGQSARKAARELAAQRFSYILRQHIGRGEKQAVVDRAVIPKRTFEGYLGGESLPALDAFLRLAAVLGPEFTNQTLEAAGQGGAHWIVSDHPVTVLDLSAVLSTAAAEITAIVNDGGLTHDEFTRIAATLRTITAKSSGFLWTSRSLLDPVQR